MQDKFNEWLDNFIESSPLPHHFMALNFNIYDIEEDTFDVQLIASAIYDENDAGMYFSKSSIHLLYIFTSRFKADLKNFLPPSL